MPGVTIAKSFIPGLLLALAALLPACASSGNSSDREWQRAQCDRVVDSDDREKCLKRVDAEYGRSSRDAEKPSPKR